MSTARKSAASAAQAAKNEVVETILPLYAKNVERIAELQKKTLEVATEQNAEFIAACKKAWSFIPGSPASFLFDLAGQNFERIVETQKSTIDLAVEKTQVAAELAKDRIAEASKIAGGMTGMLQQSIANSVAAQKKALDYYGEQHKAACETAKKQFRITENPVAEVVQNGVEALIETQKTLLDLVAKPFASFKAA